MSWLTKTHKEYDQKNGRWQYSWDQYSGEYSTQQVEFPFKSKYQKNQTYLHKKVQAETDEAFEERKITSDPVLLFPTAVDSLNGIMFAKSDETEREWGALGDPEQNSSIAFSLLHNADGDGTNWIPTMKQVGIKLTVMHKVWGLVDGIQEVEDEEGNTEKTGEASVRIINPSSVVNWWPSNGNPKQVLVREQKDARSSIMDTDNDDDEDTYILYTVDGWTRYRLTSAGEEILEQDEWEHGFYATQERRERILPIFPVEIPMPRDIGFLLAMKQNFIYNFKSIRDFAVRNTSFSWLQLVADENQYNQIIEEIKKGYRVLRLDPDNQTSAEHSYKAPPSDHLEAAADILEKDKTDFMESAFRSYGDAAKQVTATEIRQESRSGVEAFLTLLVSSMDEFENRVFWLLEQIYFPEQPSNWGKATVKRSDDFAPKDVNEVLSQMATVVRDASSADAMSLQRKVERLNPEYSEDQVLEEVQRIKQDMGMPVNNAEDG